MWCWAGVLALSLAHYIFHLPPWTIGAGLFLALLPYVVAAGKALGAFWIKLDQVGEIIDRLHKENNEQSP
jgi:hypothetical protein